MKRTAITNTVTYIEPDSMSNFKSCAGVVVSGSARIFLDVNMSKADTLTLLRSEPPDMAFISHYHLDHVIWGKLVLEHTDAELFIPEGEEAYLGSLDELVQKTAGSYGLIPEWTDFIANVIGFQGLSGFSTYMPEDRVSAGHDTIQCIPSPGHSPSHTSFYFPEEKILFTGDMGIDRFGPWYGWADCDLRELVASALRLRALDVSVLLTSHGGILTSDIEKAWDNGLRKIIEREQHIEDRLHKGKTRAEIIEQGIFFRNKSEVMEPMRSFLYMWDSYMLDQHMTVLKEGGLRQFFPEFKTVIYTEKRK